MRFTSPPLNPENHDGFRGCGVKETFTAVYRKHPERYRAIPLKELVSTNKNLGSMPRKRSIIWTIEKEILQELLDTSTSYCEVLTKLHLNSRSGGLLTYLRTRLKEGEFNLAKINTNRLSKKKKRATRVFAGKKPEEVLIKDSSKLSVREYVFRHNRLPYSCQRCENSGIWLDNPISLQLDHVNGDNKDHRLENLRWLCPNCHTQTPTWGGRNIDFKENRCSECNIKIYRTSTHCNDCRAKKDRTFEISKEDLEKMVQSSMTMEAVARKLGVKSSNTVRKRCRKLGIEWKKKIG